MCQTVGKLKITREMHVKYFVHLLILKQVTQLPTSLADKKSRQVFGQN